MVSGGKSKISKNVSWLKEIQYYKMKLYTNHAEFVKYHIIQTKKKTNITKIY